MSTQPVTKKNGFGVAGMICGGLAFAILVLQFQVGPLEPRKPIERTIAEIAVGVRKEVPRVLEGKPAVSKERSWSRDDGIKIGAGMLGTLAIILGVIGFVRREGNRAASAAVALGCAAIIFPFAIAVAAFAVVVAILWFIVSALL